MPRTGTNSSLVTPNYVLVLFITSVLALVWSIATLLRHRSTRESAIFVSFIDMCFVGAFIASVIELRDIANASCTNFTAAPLYVSLGPFGYFGQTSNSPFAADVNQTCSMLKACFAFGIMNCIFFFNTSILLLFMRRHKKDEERPVRRHRYVEFARQCGKSVADVWYSHDSRRGHSRSGHSHHHSRRGYV